MFALVSVLLSASVFQQSAPEITFVVSATTDKHVALYKESDSSYLAHFIVKMRNMKGQSAYARIRSPEVNDETTTKHTSLKIVRVESDEEYWSFDLYVPKLSETKVVYVLEVGRYDLGDLNEFQDLGTFAWRFNDRGEMSIGKEPIQVMTVTRAIVPVGGGFKIVHEMKVRMAERKLDFGIISREHFPAPEDGSQTAKRIKR